MALLLTGSSALAGVGSAHAAPQTAAEETVADIAIAKTDVANLYDGYLRGEVPLLDLRRAEQNLSRLTGTNVSTSITNRRFELSRPYRQFEQTTSYYCGPTTVQGMLWYVKGDTPGPEGARLTGRAEDDQRLLASNRWLGTERAEGTDWGNIVPDTMNQWLGNRWYAAFATASGGGNLTKDQAMRDIQYAIDHDRPVAANVMYSPGTWYPAGFSAGYTYLHWETVIGYFDRDGRRFIRLGESYGGSSGEYVPVQEVAWDDYWPTIGQWSGIVW
jgi:hypothetical protein